MTDGPKVSYVLAVRDGEGEIDRCAGSVLGQSLQDIELVVVDDHSRDGTWEAVTRLAAGDERVRGVRNHGRPGLTSSLNVGVDFARGEYVARIDVDDFAHRDKTARQAALLDSRPGAPMCSSAYRVVDHEDRELYCHCPSASPALLRWSLCFRNNIRHSTAMWRRSLDVRYDPSFDCSQDYELWCRIARLGDILVVPETLATVRSRPDSITSTRREEQEVMADRAAAGQYEFYTGTPVGPRQARNLRMVYHLKSPEQFELLHGTPPQEFEEAVERYLRLAESFARRESPDPEIFLAEVGKDVEPLLKDRRTAGRTSKAISKIAGLMGASSTAARVKRAFAAAKIL